MSNKKKSTLPNKELLDSTYNLVNSFSTKMIELNNMYLEQTRKFWQINIEHAQTLYEVNTPEEFSQKMNDIFSQNGNMLTHAFIEDLNAFIKICTEFCNSTANGSGKAQCEALKLYEFCSKLMPSPWGNNFDDIVKSAVIGNQEAISALQQVVDNATDKFESAAKTSAENIAATLHKLKTNTQKS